jgi:hypothetical protein
MVARLGNVLYWTGWLIGSGFVLLAIFAIAYRVATGQPPDLPSVGALFVGFGVIAWTIACRYVLAGW